MKHGRLASEVPKPKKAVEFFLMYFISRRGAETQSIFEIIAWFYNHTTFTQKVKDRNQLPKIITAQNIPSFSSFSISLRLCGSA